MWRQVSRQRALREYPNTQEGKRYKPNHLLFIQKVMKVVRRIKIHLSYCISKSELYCNILVFGKGRTLNPITIFFHSSFLWKWFLKWMTWHWIKFWSWLLKMFDENERDTWRWIEHSSYIQFGLGLEKGSTLDWACFCSFWEWFILILN